MSGGGAVVWITGLPSSGKSALAERLRRKLVHAKRPTILLDGDAVRAALKPAPGYDDHARRDFYETLANLAALFAAQGLVAIVPATAHLREYRERAKQLAPRYLEVYVHVSAETCAERDAKGLYAAAREGKVAGLPGADLPYEAPDAPDIIALGGYDDEAIGKILRVA